MKSAKTILITGASRGIGLLAAKTLASRGHTVYAGMRDLSERNKDAAAELAAFAQGRIVPIELDVTDETACTTAVATIEAEAPIDVLINNAGVMPVGLTEAFTMQQAEDLFDVNVYGIMRMTRAVLGHMRQKDRRSDGGRHGSWHGSTCHRAQTLKEGRTSQPLL